MCRTAELVWLCILLICVGRGVQGLVNPVVFYPLNSKYQATDISCHGNMNGTIVGAKLTKGPSGNPDNAYDFAATPKNYIEIPGTCYTDTRYSITVLVWMFHAGFSGPIVNYATDGLGVNLWMTGKDTLHGGILSRDGHTSHILSSNEIGLQYEWHYVGLSYNYSTGTAALWVDGIKVKTSYFGSFELKTTGLLQLGALNSDDRYFRGKISCLQIYDKALKESDVVQARNRCNRNVLDCSMTTTVECGGELSTLSETITSPRYPREYPANVHCVWKINVPKGKRITITFKNIDLETDNCSCGDSIEVFDGLNSWSTRLIKYCNTAQDKQMQFLSKKNTMRIEFKSNSNNHGKRFQAKYTTENIVKADEKETLDLSVHYTGIVIGVACAALFAALTIIAINHTKQSRHRRSSTMSFTRRRRSESFSATDIIVQGAPPSYDVVMRCPDLYPPSPQMSPVASITTPNGLARFGKHRHGPSPLATRTIGSSTSTRFNQWHSNGLSEDSDEEDPPPYPGIESTQPGGQSPDLQHSDQLNTTNSICGHSNDQLHLATGNNSSQDSSDRDPLGSSPYGNSPSTSPSLCLSELGTSDRESTFESHENNIHSITGQKNQPQINTTYNGRETDFNDSNQQPAATGSVNETTSVAMATDGNAEEQSKINDMENDIRNRLESQSSIVGTVV